MQASELLKAFVKRTGRRDLVKQDGYTDNGGLFFLNAAQALLDELQDHYETESWHFDQLVAGDTVVEVPPFRSVVEGSVYLVDADAGRFPLTRKPLKWLRDNYSLGSASETSCITPTTLTNKEWVAAGGVTQPSAASRLRFVVGDVTTSLTAGTLTVVGKDENGNVRTEVLNCANGAGFYRSRYLWTVLTTLTTAGFVTLGGEETLSAYFPVQTGTGVPLYFSPISLGVSPALRNTSTKNFAGMLDWAHVHIADGQFKGSEAYRGIVIAPACDAAYTFEGSFRFMTSALVNATDTTFWTEFAGGSVLLQAGQAMLEAFYRNTEGFRGALEYVRMMLNGIDADMAWDESMEGSQFESSWNETNV